MLYVGAKRSLFGLGMGRMGGVGGVSLAAQIAALFASSEQGAWYDPSDWSTLFQDSAGTTPVTAVGQPVGKMLDKSGRGNHAPQASSTLRPLLGTTARKVTNLITANSNNNVASNSNISPAPTNNVALVNAPFGITYGFQIALGATGFIQRNITISADTLWYEWSCVVFNTAPGSGAVFRTSAMGIGGQSTGNGVSYNLDTKVSNVGLLQVTDLGGNYFLFSLAFKNTSQTLFIHRLDSGAGMEKLIFSGQMLVQHTASTIRPRKPGYVSRGVLSSPYYGYADGVNYFSDDSQPYSHINAWGDSFVGAGTNRKWAVEFQRYYGAFRDNGIGGETSTQIKNRMIASATTATDIIIIECGANNAVLSTVMADIAAMVATIPHNKFVVCAICNRNDQPTQALGGAGYNNIITINNAMAAAYPNNYVDIRAALVGAYDPNAPDELAAHALDTTTTRLQGDGIHPSDAGQIAITSAIWQFMVDKGFVQSLGFTARTSVTFDGVDDVLVATFQSSLGSDCTVVQSIPGTGASILTEQTIGASYSNNTSSNGTLVFDRALTAPETALVTRWANSKAGV